MVEVSTEELFLWINNILSKREGDKDSLYLLIDLKGGITRSEINSLRIKPEEVINMKVSLETLKVDWIEFKQKEKPIQYMSSSCYWRDLKLEVNIPEGNNSGIYLRGIYEIQVLDSYGEELDSHNMGALYSRITPSTSAEKPAGSWQEMDITLANRHITVKLNGTTIIDNQPALGPTGGAMSHDVFAPGPIYLQGDHGKVSYRNIVLTPIK